MTIAFRPIRTIAEYVACEEIQFEVWRMPNYREVVPLHMLLAGHESGGFLIGAFDGDEAADRVVGFVFGIASLTPEGRLEHYSHMLAVLPAYQGRGIGRQLKAAQREAARAQGLDCIAWTYDPLESRNATLNVARLGVICRTYQRDLYGPLKDGLNAGLPTDRFKVEWHIDTDRVVRRLAGEGGATVRGAAPAHTPKRGGSGYREPGAPVLSWDTPYVEVDVPTDYQAIKAADPELALAWRLATRRIFEAYFGKGYAVIEFTSRAQDGTRRNAYVMSRDVAAALR